MTENPNGKYIIVVVGITGIVILESVAMLTGIDGQLLATAIGVIGTIVGYAFGVTHTEKQ